MNKSEILKNSKYGQYFNVDQSFSPNSENENTPNNKNDNNYTSSTKDYSKIDKSFDSIRNSYPQLLADRDAELYMENLRDIGEYNRWSLKITQQWLKTFYNRMIL